MQQRGVIYLVGSQFFPLHVFIWAPYDDQNQDVKQRDPLQAAALY